MLLWNMLKLIPSKRNIPLIHMTGWRLIKKVKTWHLAHFKTYHRFQNMLIRFIKFCSSDILCLLCRHLILLNTQSPVFKKTVAELSKYFLTTYLRLAFPVLSSLFRCSAVTQIDWQAESRKISVQWFLKFSKTVYTGDKQQILSLNVLRMGSRIRYLNHR